MRIHRDLILLVAYNIEKVELNFLHVYILCTDNLSYLLLGVRDHKDLPYKPKENEKKMILDMKYYSFINKNSVLIMLFD